jgi:hypothetical protein
VSGQVFHPGHSELHGITVVIETSGDALYVGRYHEETPAGVLLHDVAEHPGPGSNLSREEFLARTLKFGVRADRRNLVVPSSEVRQITRLADWAKQ